jgi:hypothetical protein
VHTIVSLIGLLVLAGGALGFVLMPICVAGFFFSLAKLGDALKTTDPDVWDEVRPRLYSSMGRQSRQRERLNFFIREREYLAYGDAKISALGDRARMFDRGMTVCFVMWIAALCWVFFS